MTSIEAPNWKRRLELFFGRFGLLLFRRPWISLAIFMVALGALGSQLRYAYVDSTFEGFLQPDDPELAIYDDFRRQFGRDEFITLGFEPPDVWDVEFLDDLRQLHERIELELPFYYDVDSLINARNVYGQDDELIVEDLFATFPTDATALSTIRNVALANPLYRSSLLSPDGTMTFMMIKLVPFYTQRAKTPGEPDIVKNLADVQMGEAVNALRALLDDYPRLRDSALISGTVPLVVAISASMQRDFGLFTGVCLLMIGTVLFVIFRRPSAVVMPLLAMIATIVATVAVMAATNTPMQMSTSILPSFILAVCIGDAIHLLSLFYRHFDVHGDKAAALRYGLEHAGVPMLFTSITTAAGLASFSGASITAIANLGIFSAVGALLAWVMTMTLLPILISLLPLKQPPANRMAAAATRRPYLTDRFAKWSAKFSASHPWKIVVFNVGLLAVTAWLAKDLQYSHNALTWFDESTELRQSVKRVEAKDGGTMTVEVILDTGRDRGIVDSGLLKQVEKLQAKLETYHEGDVRITKTIGLPALVKETNRGLAGNDPNAYVIPDDNDLIGQELLLVELGNGQELFKLIDGEYRKLRTTILLTWVDAFYYEEFLRDVMAEFEAHVGEYGDIVTTGMTAIFGKTFAAMLRSTGTSYMIAGVVITIMMCMLLGSLKLGLISMFPNLIPIMSVLSFMVVFGAPLDMFSLLVGSISLGLIVDDTVHFMHGFRRAYAEHGDVEKAIEVTLTTIGRAMIITTIVLSLGFSVYLLSDMHNLDDFAVLTVLCVSIALLTDFWLAPALMVLLYRNKNVSKGKAS